VLAVTSKPKPKPVVKEEPKVEPKAEAEMDVDGEEPPPVEAVPAMEVDE
jgi:hypothetical protein